MRFSDFLDVSDIPDVQTMIVVDDGDFEILLIISHSCCIWIASTMWMGHHMTYGQAFGHVNTQVVSPWQRRYKLQGVRRKTTNYAVGTANENEIFANA